MKRAPLMLWLAGVAIAGPARATFFGDSIQIEILRQNIQQTLNFQQQLTQVRDVLQTTREELSLARNAYALGNDIVNFNPDQFLAESQAYFWASQPVLSDARALGNDIATRGVRNSFFNASQVNRMIAVYQEDKKAGACGCDCNGHAAQGALQGNPECPLVCIAAHQRGYPYSGCTDAASTSGRALAYDEDAARRLSAAADVVAYDKEARDKLLERPSTASASDGLFYADLARTDPGALDALLRQRAVAAKAGADANALYIAANDKDLSVASAGAITARTSSLAAEQLAAIREGQAKQVALQQRQATREELARAQEEDERRHTATRMSRLLYESVSSQPLPSNPYR